MKRFAWFSLLLSMLVSISVLGIGEARASSWSVARVSGSDRFDTAVQVSIKYFGSGAPNVVIASGANFADSLSGSALAARLESPLLLVRKESAPEAVLGEIARLKPARVIVLGGLAAIAQATVEQIDGRTNAEIIRLGGETRYETSARIVEYGWSTTAESVYLASGEGYPAGLLAGGAAAIEDSPVLLTRPTSLSSTTIDLIRRLKPRNLRVVSYGSSGAGFLSASVVESARSASTTGFSWINGTDLYDVSLALAKIPGRVTSTVVMTTSEAFPDALAAGGTAGFLGQTLLMTGRTCMPKKVVDFLGSNDVTALTVVGGSAAISEDSARGVACLTGVQAGQDWETGPLPNGVTKASIDQLVATAFGDVTKPGRVRSVVIVIGDKIVYEKYHPMDTAQSPMVSYSMAKSITSTIIGMLVADGKLSLDQPAPVTTWQGAGDGRKGITVRHLLNMASGLKWTSATDNVRITSATAASDYAAAMPLAATPGSLHNYSSGDSAILMRIATDVLGGPTATNSFMKQRLFDPLGISSERLFPDKSGRWPGYWGLNMTARDWARFGVLYLNEGLWGGKRVVSDQWVDFSKTPSPQNDKYGGHWWIYEDAYSAEGFGGQYVLVSPSKNMVMVITAANSNDSLFGLPTVPQDGQAVRSFVLRQNLYDLFPVID